VNDSKYVFTTASPITLRKKLTQKSK